MEIDIRKAGHGCIDNPVHVLSDILAKGVPVKVLLRKDQKELVEELLEIAEYRVLDEEDRGDHLVIVAEKENS